MSDYKLQRCVWEITLACCFSCRYCGSRGGRARQNELTTEECLRVADELAELGCRRISLIGGEVFMRKDWQIICERITNHKIALNIITNGFLFNGNLLNNLKDINVESVSVSLDGPKQIHDKYRQEGSFDRAYNAIFELTKAGIPTSVISTLNSENINCLEELYELLKEYPIFAWQLQSCSPMGNAVSEGIPYAYDQKKAIEFVAEYMKKAPFSIGVADNIGYFTYEEGSIRGNMGGQAFFKGCGAGITSIGIDSIGNVRGCESMYDDYFIEGNLREKTLREIWENPNGFSYNRTFQKTMLTGKCATCELGEYCGGGCRSYNYFVHGKMYEAKYCARN